MAITNLPVVTLPILLTYGHFLEHRDQWPLFLLVCGASYAGVFVNMTIWSWVFDCIDVRRYKASESASRDTSQ